MYVYALGSHFHVYKLPIRKKTRARRLLSSWFLWKWRPSVHCAEGYTVRGDELKWHRNEKEGQKKWWKRNDSRFLLWQALSAEALLFVSPSTAPIQKAPFIGGAAHRVEFIFSGLSRSRISKDLVCFEERIRPFMWYYDAASERKYTSLSRVFQVVSEPDLNAQIAIIFHCGWENDGSTPSLCSISRRDRLSLHSTNKTFSV